MRLPLIFLTAVLLAGCAEDSSPQTRDALRDRVGAVVAAANAGDAATARTALAALRADVGAARRLGSLSVDQATDLTRLADDVEAALPSRPSPAQPPPPPAPEPEPEPEPKPEPEPEPEPEPGGDGKGKDGDKDDEKDD